MSAIKRCAATAATAVAIASAPAAANASCSSIVLPYQQAWIYDDSPIAIWEKSRRIGADWTEALRVVRERMNGSRSLDYWYSSADESAAVEFMLYVKMWAVDLYGQVLEISEGTEVFEGRDVRVMSVTLPEVKGRRPRIVAMASSPKAFRSKGGDVGISEFAFHQDAEALWKAAAPVTMWGGRIRVISTHHGVKSHFNTLVTQARRRLDPDQATRATDIDASVHRVTIDDAVEQGLVERINSVTGQNLTREEFIAAEQAKCGDDRVWCEEYMCEPSEEQASYFPYDLLRPVATERAEIVTDDPNALLAMTALAASGSDATPTANAVYAGCDVGRKRDLFTVWTLVRRGGMRRTAAVYGEQGISFGAMKSALCPLLDSGLTRLAIDATGLGMQLAEELHDRYRSRVEPVTVTGPVKEDLVTTARRDIEELTVTLPNDLAVLGEFNAFKKTLTSAGNPRYVADDSREGHCDRAFAGFLAMHAAKRVGAPARRVTMKGGAVG